MGRITIAIYSAIVSLILAAPAVLIFYISIWLGNSNYKISCNATSVVQIAKIDDLVTKLKWITIGVSAGFLLLSILLIVSLFFIPPIPKV
jgi:hypothetical protein